MKEIERETRKRWCQRVMGRIETARDHPMWTVCACLRIGVCDRPDCTMIFPFLLRVCCESELHAQWSAVMLDYQEQNHFSKRCRIRRSWCS